MDEKIGFTDEQFESGLYAVESEYADKVPSNIEEIEDILGEAKMSDEFDHLSATPDEVAAFLRSKGVELQSDPDTLVMVLGLRLMKGEANYFKGRLQKQRKQAAQDYERLKDRAPVQDTFTMAGGMTEEFRIFLLRFDEQDAKLKGGASFNDIYTTLVYRDDPPSNLAFVLLVEEKTGKKVDSGKALYSLANLEAHSDIENSYNLAREYQLSLSLAKALRLGAKWNDLVALSPSMFGLPEKWFGLIDREVDALDVIRREIFYHFGFDRQADKPAVRDVAEELGAPYEQILRASAYYEW